MINDSTADKTYDRRMWTLAGPMAFQSESMMKIQGRKQITPLGSAGPLAGPSFREVDEPQAAPASDQVDLSSTQELRRLNAAAQALPEVRMEKVEGLRGQIEDGNYYVESDKLARKVVDEALNDMLFSSRQPTEL